MIDISCIAKNIKFLEEGIWVSKNMSVISYPDNGNADCFNIEERSFWFKHRNDCIIETVNKFQPAGPIFDIGGGNGYVSMGLKDNGYNTVLVEPGIEGARNARSRGLYPIICSTLNDAEFYEGSMPAVGLFDVLEHIEDDAGFLKKIGSLLIPGGRLYATVPAYKSLWSTEDDFAKHYRRYTQKELKDKLRSAGFEVEYSTYFFTLLTLPIFLFRTVPSKLGIRKSGESSMYKKEHNVNSKLINIPLQAYLSMELDWIKKGNIGVGASCLVVASAKK